MGNLSNNFAVTLVTFPCIFFIFSNFVIFFSHFWNILGIFFHYQFKKDQNNPIFLIINVNFENVSHNCHNILTPLYFSAKKKRCHGVVTALSHTKFKNISYFLYLRTKYNDEDIYELFLYYSIYASDQTSWLDRIYMVH